MAELSAVYPHRNEVVERGEFTAREIYDYGLIRLQIFRHRSAEEAAAALDIALPEVGMVAAADNLQVYWVAPGEWLIRVARESEAGILADFTARLDRSLGVLTLVTDSRGAVLLSGKAVLDVLARGSMVDFHPRAFPAGCCLTTQFAKTPSLVVHQSEAEYLVFVCRSVMAYLLEWLAANTTDL